jgi:hypothetical protein
VAKLAIRLTGEKSSSSGLLVNIDIFFWRNNEG